MNKFSSRAISAAILSLSVIAVFSTADANAVTRRGHHVNADGGVSGGVIHASEGPNGGAFASGRRVVTDGAGDGSITSGGAFKGADSATGFRAGRTTRSADGSVAHNSGFEASASKGAIQSQGSASKTANGTVTQSRDTTATSTATGTTYQGNTSYSKETGVTHTGTCTNAAGVVVPCK